MPYAGDDYLKLLDLTGEGHPQKYNMMLSDYHRLLAARRSLPCYRDLGVEVVKEHLDGVRERLKEATGFIDYEDHSAPEFHRAGVAKAAGSEEQALVERDGYTIVKGWFEGGIAPASAGSTAGWPVSALLYLPEPAPKTAPAVLCVHGHARATGKLQYAMQNRCVGLVRRGFVVLAIDATGHGERRPSGHENFEIFAAGMSPQALLVRDNMRAVDLLASLPYVDAGRIGITGSSGGGNQSMYTAALDARIAAAVPTASVCAYEDHMMHASSDYCPCEAVPGMVQFADVGDMLALIAPRPVLVLSGTRDRTFPVKGARESYLRARDAYSVLGAGERIEIWEEYTPHSYSRGMREAMYRFFEKHLMGRAEHEGEDFPQMLEPVNADTLRVFAGGEFPKGHQTLSEFVWERARGILDDKKHPANKVKKAADLKRFRDGLLGDWEECFGGPVEEGFQPRALKSGKRGWGRYEAHTFVVETERGILVPSVVLTDGSGRSGEKPLVVVLARAGKDEATWVRSSLRLVDAGFAVAGLDVRGTGETCYLWQGEEDTAALNAVISGRSLLAGRAEDAAGFIEAVVGGGLSPSAQGVVVWVRDAFSEYGLLTALRSGRVEKVVMENGLLSAASRKGFASLNSPALFTPGMLRRFDFVHLLGLLAPRPVACVNPIDGNGEALAAKEAEGLASWATKAYGLAGAPGAFSLRCGMSEAEKEALVSGFLGEGAAE